MRYASSKVNPSIEVNSSNLPGNVSIDVILNEKATGNITLTDSAANFQRLEIEFMKSTILSQILV